MRAAQPEFASPFQRGALITNLLRLGFLALVAAVLFGVWTVLDAHLSEQLLGAPQNTAGLIDPRAGQNVLTPDNIEQQILAFNLRLRERIEHTGGRQSPASAPLQ
ncbi:MAG: hypothetical protein R2911_42180 [Caldilineaceae bacterium]